MDDPEKYYEKVLRDYSSVNNANARRQYFEHTEPGDRSEPTHQRVLHTRRAKAIASSMIAKIAYACVKNSRRGIMRGTAIPHWNDLDEQGCPMQPMHDVENPLFDYL